MKNTMKRLMALLVAVIMLLSLAACGQKDAKDDGKAITVEVQGADGKSVTFTVNTDEETVGAALLKLGVIAGEDSDYGLYVKTVNGETADYDKDGAYWAFYVNGEYAMTGVDYTAPEAGTTYGFHVEKSEG